MRRGSDGAIASAAVVVRKPLSLSGNPATALELVYAATLPHARRTSSPAAVERAPAFER